MKSNKQLRSNYSIGLWKRKGGNERSDTINVVNLRRALRTNPNLVSNFQLGNNLFGLVFILDGMERFYILIDNATFLSNSKPMNNRIKRKTGKQTASVLVLHYFTSLCSLKTPMFFGNKINVFFSQGSTSSPLLLSSSSYSSLSTLSNEPSAAPWS